MDRMDAKIQGHACLNQVSLLHFSNEGTRFSVWIYLFIEVMVFNHRSKLSFIWKIISKCLRAQKLKHKYQDTLFCSSAV
jgi:hypothetical protein